MATATPAGAAADAVKLSAHALRVQILTHINDEGEASPNEMAKAFAASLPLVSYHVRILREGGAITLVRTTPRRGAIEHHYKLSPLGERIRQRYGPVPRALEDLRGVHLVLGCQHKGCGAKWALNLVGGDADPGYALGHLGVMDFIAEEWPTDGWQFVQTPRGYELACPEHAPDTVEP